MLGNIPNCLHSTINFPELFRMTADSLNIAVFQFDLSWENPLENRSEIERMLLKTDRKTEVVFLPEMFTTGFSMNASKLAETMNGPTVTWMKKLAAEYRMALCGSVIIQENGKFFNRLLFTEPSGEIHTYDKRHLFSMGNEPDFFNRGTERLIVNYKGWRIFPLICYDLRFPVWARNRNEYDLLFYSANWPQSRALVWNTLLKARSIENQCYTVGANRVGTDGNGIGYSGNSQVIHPKGIVMAEAEDSSARIVEATLSMGDLLKFRASFPVLDDADHFQLEN